MNPHDITQSLEEDLCNYCGSRFAVVTNSCTNALQLALMWHRWNSGPSRIELPARTYPGVPHAVINAGHEVSFRDYEWRGAYKLDPLPVWDAAKRFTSGMAASGGMWCVSFHVSKILGCTQGGAVLLDDPEAADFMRRARFDGRTPGVSVNRDRFREPAIHAYLSPDVAAQIRWKLSWLPADNEDLPTDDYPDLREHSWFRSPLRQMRKVRRREGLADG